jgi:hypothetical protein
MLERFSISIAAATIIGVLGKLALLYHTDKEAGKDWFSGPIQQAVFCNLMLAIFLIFFRGKIMHDDATFYSDLSKEGTFKSGRLWRFLIKFGLLLGYISWLLWAPAIYFLDDHTVFSGFLITSLVLSTFWLIIDLLTRTVPEWRRAFWVIPNVFYIGFLVLLLLPAWAPRAAIGLLAVLIFDWLISDPLSGHVATSR